MGLIASLTKQELYAGNSEKEYNRIRTLLKTEQIGYKDDIVSKGTSGLDNTRGRTGTFGQNPKYEKTYYIYVDKKDYEKAKYLLKKQD